MDQIRRALATVQKYLGEMESSQKLLIGSLAVVAVLVLVLVTQFAAKPDMLALSGIPADQTDASVASLRTAGIKAELSSGGVMVPVSQRTAALAALQSGGNLPADTTLLFNTLIAQQDWRNSREQNRQQFIFALQNELGAVIGKFRGVSSATVIIDDPPPQGLGRAVRPPSASVTVFGSGGGIGQELVDAAATLVAGARSGLSVENVRVIDGTTGRQRQARSDDSMVAGSYLEHRLQVESKIQRKLEDLLGYIPGVMVAVTADVDIAAVSEQTKKHYSKEDGGTVQLERSVSEQAKTETAGTSGAEPGMRSNQAADINFGGASEQTAYEETDADTQFENFVGTEIRETHDPRGMPTFLAASINIPEAYVTEQVRKGKAIGLPEGEEPEPPTAAEIQSRFTDVRDQIERSILPHVKTRAADGVLIAGEVNVSMVPVDLPSMAGGPQAAGLFGMASGSMPEWMGGGSMLDTALVGLLAIVAMAMMVTMVKRSSKKIELPSAEELVGIPPALEADSDMLGEADEGDNAMAGIEVGDEQVERQAVLDQVTEMVKSDPEKAAKLMGRWLAIES